MKFANYACDGFWDELMRGPGQPREGAEPLIKHIEQLPDGDLLRKQRSAETRLLDLGITFTVYGSEDGTERIFPFDIIPRMVDGQAWERIERGLAQRIQALNHFVHDIYHEQHILRDGVVPAELIRDADTYRPQCQGLKPPQGVWIHITGTDLVRDRDGAFYVLEDNLRCPSGVSYVLENRQVLKRTFPSLFRTMRVRPVDDYPHQLLETLQHASPQRAEAPNVVILTPGVYNSAYFEHAFLAQQMGVDLVQGSDLLVKDGYVWLRTTHGLCRVDVIYRRVDDDFIDPLVFREDSVLGVPGLMEVYRAGRVALANAPGTGVADDKAVYAYVEQMIKYYLGEDAILPNVQTYVCWDRKQREYVLANMDKLVVKAVNQSGGYGMIIGPAASAAEREAFAEQVKARPRDYIAQPTLALSRAPVIVDGGFEGRHVDLRPFVLNGQQMYVMPGGLTRVALRKGSLVVNSSQGGGSKDTWVLDG